MRTDVHADPTKPGHTGNGGGRRWGPWKIALWAAPALFMLLMLINNRLGDGEGWSVGDFVFAGVVLYGALGAYEWVTRRPGNPAQRAGFGLGIAALVLLLWGNAAVGITDTDADGWYLAVVAVGVIGALGARFRPRGMAWAMAATVVALVLAGATALVAGKIGPNNSAPEILAITAFYAILFAGSAWLFRQAAHKKAGPATA